MKMAAQELEGTYYADRRPNPVTVHSIGHTHIDVAWKWPCVRPDKRQFAALRRY